MEAAKQQRRKEREAQDSAKKAKGAAEEAAKQQRLEEEALKMADEAARMDRALRKSINKNGSDVDEDYDGEWDTDVDADYSGRSDEEALKQRYRRLKRKKLRQTKEQEQWVRERIVEAGRMEQIVRKARDDLLRASDAGEKLELEPFEEQDDSAKSLDNLTLLFGDDSWGKEAPERALDETMGSMEIKPRASISIPFLGNGCLELKVDLGALSPQDELLAPQTIKFAGVFRTMQDAAIAYGLFCKAHT
ncbi:hypothetical protein NKR23_g10241 [Pleurostoma richardsiae]|uniref:Uncharacterized protein n=1 Tax=Pleurostoma richardsiae TaxID=41990 RepID=A0AA38R3D1_9PEZI|nr:hypothetical protein NKR23_g10241 [Pleurostoma richardsiae]